MPSLLAKLIGIAGIALPAALPAVPLQNGDFSAGFAGWEGVIEDAGGPRVVDPAVQTNHFTLLPLAPDPPDLAFLHFDFGVPVFAVTLRQSFTVDPLLAQIAISFDWLWAPTDEGADEVFARLAHDGGAASIDLFDLDGVGGPDVDLTVAGRLSRRSVVLPASALIGDVFTIAFGLVDRDGDIADGLVLDNVSIGAPAQVVTAPPSLWLAGLGLAGLLPRRRGCPGQASAEDPERAPDQRLAIRA